MTINITRATEATDFHLSMQTGPKILYIHMVPRDEIDGYHVQLFHNDIVKGIPSFRMHGDMEQVRAFVNGFIFGNLSEQYYAYCEIMISAFFGNDLVLDLFNVQRQGKPMRFEQLPGASLFPKIRG